MILNKRNFFANKVVSFEALHFCWFEFFVLFCILCLMLWDDHRLGEGFEHRTAEELRDPKGLELPVPVAARCKA